MSTIANLGVVISARADGLTRVMNSATAGIQKLQGTAQRATGYMKYLFAAAAGAGLVVLAKNAMSNIDRIAKLSDTMGIATEDIVKFEHAAALANVSTGEMTMGLTFLARNLGNAKQGSKEAADAFKSIGLSSDKLTKMTPAEAFMEVAESIKKLPSPALQASAAMQIFGRSGVRLLPLLKEGKTGLKALGEEAERLGLTFDRVDAAKVEEANDAMTRVGEVFQGVVQKAVIQFAPLIEAAAKAFTDWATSGEGAAAKVVGVFEWVVTAVAKILDVFEEIKVGARSIGLAFRSVSLLAAEAFLWVFSTIEGVYNKMVGMVNSLIDNMAHAAKKLPGGGAVAGGLYLLKSRKIDLTSKTRALIDEESESLKKKYDDLYKYVGSREWPSSQVKAFFDKLKANAAGARAALLKTTEAKKLLAAEYEKAEAFRKATEQVDEYNKKLEEQVKLFGLTAEQAGLLKLQEAGKALSPEFQDAFNKELEKTVALQSQLAALESGKKASAEALKRQEELIAKGKSVFEETRTPIEKYEAKISELNELLDQGVITWDTYGRAVRAAKTDLEGPRDKMDAGTFQTIRTSLVDVKGLNMGPKDPMIEKVDKTNEILGHIQDDIRETRFETQDLA